MAAIALAKSRPSAPGNLAAAADTDMLILGVRRGAVGESRLRGEPVPGRCGRVWAARPARGPAAAGDCCIAVAARKLEGRLCWDAPRGLRGRRAPPPAQNRPKSADSCVTAMARPNSGASCAAGVLRSDPGPPRAAGRSGTTGGSTPPARVWSVYPAPREAAAPAAAPASARRPRICRFCVCVRASQQLHFAKLGRAEAIFIAAQAGFPPARAADGPLDTWKPGVGRLLSAWNLFPLFPASRGSGEPLVTTASWGV